MQLTLSPKQEQWQQVQQNNTVVASSTKPKQLQQVQQNQNSHSKTKTFIQLTIKKSQPH